MALLTNTIAPGRLELRRIHNVAVSLHVLLAGSVTSFTPHTAFEKWRIQVSILGIRHGLRAARVAVQARFFNGLRQIDILLTRVTRREIPVPY
jgi:hypothetical protein